MTGKIIWILLKSIMRLSIRYRLYQNKEDVLESEINRLEQKHGLPAELF